VEQAILSPVEADLPENPRVEINLPIVKITTRPVKRPHFDRKGGRIRLTGFSDGIFDGIFERLGVTVRKLSQGASRDQA
jgi:hypothetical protein